jgi:hypothetical protein
MLSLYLLPLSYFTLYFHFLPFTFYHLPFTNYLLPFTFYHLPFTFYLLPFTFYVYYFTIYHLPFTFYLLRLLFYLLPFTFYVVFILPFSFPFNTFFFHFHLYFFLSFTSVLFLTLYLLLGLVSFLMHQQAYVLLFNRKSALLPKSAHLQGPDAFKKFCSIGQFLPTELEDKESRQSSRSPTKSRSPKTTGKLQQATFTGTKKLLVPSQSSEEEPSATSSSASGAAGNLLLAQVKSKLESELDQRTKALKTPVERLSILLEEKAKNGVLAMLIGITQREDVPPIISYDASRIKSNKWKQDTSQYQNALVEQAIALACGLKADCSSGKIK